MVELKKLETCVWQLLLPRRRKQQLTNPSRGDRLRQPRIFTVTMSNESQDTKEKKLEEAASQGSLKDPGLVYGNGTDGNFVELDDFSQNESKQSSDSQDLQSGLCRAPVSIDVHVVRAPQAPKLLQGDRAAGVNRDLVQGSSDSLQMDGGTLQCDSDYSSMKSSPGYACTSFSPVFCEERLSELDRSILEKTSTVSSVNFSASYSKTSKINSPNNGSDISKTDFNIANSKAVNSVREGTSARDRQALRTRNSLDTRSDKKGRESDRRSDHSRRTVKEGMCCCYQTVHRGCLQCVEETPAMLPGLVLSLAFCVTIIVLIPSTGRVRHLFQTSAFDQNAWCVTFVQSDLLTHKCLCVEHRGPRRCSVGGVRGSFAERHLAGLPTLARYGEALQRGAGAVCVGNPLRCCHSLHLYWRTCDDMGTGQGKIITKPKVLFYGILVLIICISLFHLLRWHFSSSSLWACTRCCPSRWPGPSLWGYGPAFHTSSSSASTCPSPTPRRQTWWCR